VKAPSWLGQQTSWASYGGRYGRYGRRLLSTARHGVGSPPGILLAHRWGPESGPPRQPPRGSSRRFTVVSIEGLGVAVDAMGTPSCRLTRSVRREHGERRGSTVPHQIARGSHVRLSPVCGCRSMPECAGVDEPDGGRGAWRAANIDGTTVCQGSRVRRPACASPWAAGRRVSTDPGSNA